MSQDEEGRGRTCAALSGAGFRQRTNETVWLDWKQEIYTVQPVIQGLQRKHDAYKSLKSAVASLFQLELKPASYCEHDHTLTLRIFGDQSWIFTAVAYLHAFQETHVIFQWHSL